VLFPRWRTILRMLAFYGICEEEGCSGNGRHTRAAAK
jgi:hypothetical protein